MKVLIGTDLEGVAGVVSFENQAYADAKYYEQAKKLLTAEINAAVDGLVEAGAEEILVVDGHGPGAVSFEDLHPKAKLLHGRPFPPLDVKRAINKEFDVCMMLGQHAMAGTKLGTLNHTQASSSIDYYKLNGELIGEIAQFALEKGALGLPMIFLSGDDAACEEATTLIPEITTASVKRGVGRNSAISVSAVEAHRLIREGVVAAVQKHNETPLQPLSIPGPYVLDKRFFHTHVADMMTTNPLVERVDSQTIRYTSDDILDVIYA
ncbi:MAG: M55 family metallopeptidase [Victivallales bacterium]|nr:M55 family metallopeptidase [Victivallales bacterium]